MGFWSAVYRNGVTAASGRRCCSALRPSDHARRAQLGDVGLVVTKAAQDLVVVLAVIGGRRIRSGSGVFIMLIAWPTTWSSPSRG